MVASLFLSRLLGLLRDTVIASHFGLLSANDSYRIAVQIPDLIFMLIAGGGLSSAFIPVFSEFWYTDRRKEAWRVFSVVVTVCSIIALLLIAIAWALTPAIVERYAHGRADVIPAAILMSRIMLPAQFAFLIGSILLATLYARRQFLGPGLAPNVYNIGIIVGAAVLPGIFGFGIIGVAWGALAGAFIGNILLPVVMMLPQGGSFIPSLDVRAPGVSKFFKLLLPVILGFSLPSMVNLVTQYFASPYGPGSNTVLSYSNNLMQAPLGIFGQSLALGAFPALSQFFAEKRMDLYRDLVSKTLRTVLYLCIPSAVLMFAMAPLLVKIIYGYGKASTDPAQLDLIATCLRIYCIAIPAWCIQPVMMRGFFSLHNTLKPVAIGTAMTGLFIVLCMLVKKNPIGVLALPWAANIAAILLVGVLVVALEKEVGRLDRRGIAIISAKALIASVPAGLLAYAASTYVPAGHKLAAIILFIAVGFLAAMAYYGCTRLLKVTEIAYLDRAFSRLGKRGHKA
jgi:putative peptidoglycan lipid II flippase